MKQRQKAELPYEKFVRIGPDSLTDSELLAIILRTGTRDNPAVELAGQVLAMGKYPRTGLLGLYDLKADELMKIKGIGPVKAVKLKCLAELSMRFSRACAEKGVNIHSPETIASYFMEKLRHLKRECVFMACLDAKGQLISEKRISDGSVNRALLSPREVFIEALNEEAVALILVHNHPSGDPSPSQADREITAQIKEAGDLVGIPLLDHVIIGDNTYFSFKNAGIF